MPAPASGVITKLLVSPDDTVQIGQTLAELDTSAEVSADGGFGNGASATADGERELGPGLTAGATGEGDADLGDETAPSNAPPAGRDGDRDPHRGPR